jgi:hypothetical protein
MATYRNRQWRQGQDLQRIRLTLPNGNALSIIQGPGAYASQATVEVALVNSDGDLVGEPQGHVNAKALAFLILNQE